MLTKLCQFNLNTTHIGTARLADDKQLHDDYREAVRKLVQSTNAQERKSHHELITSIKEELKVGLHQFYRVDDPALDTATTRVWSEEASLADILNIGVSEALQKRLGPSRSSKRKDVLPKPLIEVRGASESRLQTSNVRAPPDINIQQAVEPTVQEGGLRAPSISFPETIHTRRPSATTERRESEDRTSFDSTTGHPRLAREPAPQRAHTFQSPFNKRDKFQWVHVPACVPGLVPKIMTALERDKARPGLQKKVLMDQNWLWNHNKSRHASSHARFVRSFFKLLMPKGNAPSDEILSPTSSGGDPQLALYMPYMHWDTYSQLKTRSEILRKRREMKSARPVDRKVLTGASLEHKLIWQFLNLGSSSIHCRRTLDVSSPVALRTNECNES